MTPEFCDERLDALQLAHDHARREGDQLAARVRVRALCRRSGQVTGELRKLARGDGIFIPATRA